MSQTISHYRIIKKIGAGGMGEVYLAEDTRLHRKVALKILSAELTKNADRLRRFEQEAFAASALSHPNILVIHEIAEAAGYHFIATEFIEGDTIRHRLAKKKLGLEEALEVAVQAAGALASAHKAGIIHRDIKPENIMLRPDGYVKVLDFGLAKLTERHLPPTETEAPTIAKVDTDPGTIMGTVNYMSPEQARGLTVDARTDIFSLGVVIYEMITGHAPFEGETTSDIIALILDKEPPPLARYAREVPETLEWIVTKALRKNRDERYQTAKDFHADLRGLKQRLEFQAEAERSLSPETSGVSALVTGGGQAAAATAAALLPHSSEAAARITSSAEYLVSEIKRHKRAVIVALAVTIIAAAAMVYLFTRGSKALDSIAVLPLVNAGGDANIEYISDGLSESLINSLTQLQQLRVVARSTAFRYKGKEVDPQAVGRDLNVRAVLMGRVRQMGDTVNIQVDLVDVTTGAQLWGEEYNKKAADILAVKQDISREITEKLRLRLTGEEQKQLARRDTTNPEAYQLYLKGRSYWNKRTAEGIRKAIEQFQQAADKDANYAMAYVGLADCYAVLDEYAGTPTSETIPKAKAFAERALQLDSSLAEAHATLGQINNNLWQWAEAEKEFKRSIELNPNYPTTHHWYSALLRKLKRYDEAQAEIKRAQELDPLSLVINTNIALLYLARGEVNAAMEQSRKVIEINPSFPGAHRTLGLAYLKQQRYPEAIAECQKAAELSDRAGRNLADLGLTYGLARQREQALAILKELEGKYDRRENLDETNIAVVYAGLGDKDQAFAWLEKAFQVRSGQLTELADETKYDTLRTDPRYADLMRRMGLKP